jgi:serine protease Do
VHPAGPADRAGLRRGDVLLRVDGRELASRDAFVRGLESRKPGERVRIELLRGRARLELEVVLGNRKDAADPLVLLPPPPAPEPVPRPTVLVAPDRSTAVLRAIGLELADVTPDLRLHLGAPPGAGMLVTRVGIGSPAASAGVLVGDVLVELDDHPVGSSRDVEKVLLTTVSGERRTGLATSLIRDGERRSIELPFTVTTVSGVRGGALREAALVEELHRLRSEAEQLARRIEALERALALSREGREGGKAAKP